MAAGKTVCAAAYPEGDHNAKFCSPLNSGVKHPLPFPGTAIQSRKREVEEMPLSPLNGYEDEREGMLYTGVQQQPKLYVAILLQVCLCL